MKNLSSLLLILLLVLNAVCAVWMFYEGYVKCAMLNSFAIGMLTSSLLYSLLNNEQAV